MPITITHPVNILVVGKDPEILKVVLRLLNDHQPAHYHAIGSTDPDQARSLFADTDIDLTADKHPEFRAWRWVALGELPDLIVPFKRELYLSVVAAFAEFGGA